MNFAFVIHLFIELTNKIKSRVLRWNPCVTLDDSMVMELCYLTYCFLTVRPAIIQERQY